VSEHALRVLEYPRVLDAVAGRASSVLGKEHVRSLRPSGDVTGAARELARVGAVMRFLNERPAWGMPPVPDVYAALDRLGAEGAVLDAPQVYLVGVVLTSSRTLGEELGGGDGAYPELSTLRERLWRDRSLEDSVRKIVDVEGVVLDSASRELRSIRQRLHGAHARIVRQLEAFLRNLPERIVVPDASVSIREGRYVIPVRREGKGDVGGVIHGESATGATLFVEPPVALTLMNELRELEREEAREIHRILREVSGGLAPHRDVLTGAVEALVDFDSLHARARTAMAWKAEVPALVARGEGALEIRGGRHPVLVEMSGEDVIPFDLIMEPEERVLVVSGPNTGGKSVFLKAVGLVSALAQSGIVPPVGEGTRLVVFRSFFADIGDEQSIAHSLSTFSAHLTNLLELVRRADTDSLVLIDEMGTGTDPAEGAALARAILEELSSRGGLAVVTSHLGELKRLDHPGSGIVNASLQFDGERMEPTYHLVKGRPGRSFGLAIARRLGFPAELLDRAESYREAGEAELEELLTRLESREEEARLLVEALEVERREAEGLRAEVAVRAETLRKAERESEGRAREEARRVLLEARSEVDAAIREVREATAADLDEASRQARSRVEAAAREQRAAVRAGASSRSSDVRVAPGDRVRIRSTGGKGRVVEVRARRASVEVGAMRMEIPVHELEPLEGAAPQPEERGSAGRGHGGWSGPEAARMEVDLRGLRVDELVLALSRALDDAVLEDLADLRIIHGKGTGALRQRTQELLAGDSRVVSYRMGGPTEGGAGVTVVSFR